MSFLIRESRRSSVIDQELDFRLTNWARYYRDRPKVHVPMLAKLIALLGAPEDFYQDDSKSYDPIDPADAALVEKALCSPLYPEKYRLMMCVLYLRPGIRVKRLGRALGLNRHSFCEETRRASVMLKNILDFYARDKTVDFKDDKA